MGEIRTTVSDFPADGTGASWIENFSALSRVQFLVYCGKVHLSVLGDEGDVLQ